MSKACNPVETSSDVTMAVNKRRYKDVRVTLWTRVVFINILFDVHNLHQDLGLASVAEWLALLAIMSVITGLDADLGQRFL